MKCFTHQGRDAIGICKACNKGICSECAADLGHSLACKSPLCEDKAHLMDSSIKRSMMILKGTKRFVGLFPVLMVFLGSAIIYIGIVARPYFDFAIVIGVGLLVFAGIYFFVSRKWIQIPDSENKNP